MRKVVASVCTAAVLIGCASMGQQASLGRFDPRLNRDNVSKLVVGQTTKQQVAQLLGQPDPYSVSRMALVPREVWEYKWRDFQDKRVLWLEFSDDGILRQLGDSRDDYHESPGGGMG